MFTHHITFFKVGISNVVLTEASSKANGDTVLAVSHAGKSYDVQFVSLQSKENNKYMFSVKCTIGKLFEHGAS